MEIRLVKPEERIHYLAVCQTVFYGSPPLDIRGMIAGKVEHDDKGDDPIIAAFDDGGNLLSGMTIIPYTILMHGKEVCMGGIAGVATKPEARGRGLVRQIFGKACQLMSKNNQIYSFLYPFSFDYYRKLGYEHCYPYYSVKIPTMQLMSSYPNPSQARAHEPGDDITPYAALYESFTKNRNFAVVRDKKAWERLLDRDPYQRLQFTYLFGPAGSPTAYVLYDAKRGGEDLRNCRAARL